MVSMPFSLRTVLTSSVKKCARTTNTSSFSALPHLSSFCEIKNSVCLKLNFFQCESLIIMFKIAIALVELLWDCSMLILKSTSLISVSFSDCSSVFSSCIVSSVFSFCCSSVSNSCLSSSSVSISSFYFIFFA